MSAPVPVPPEVLAEMATDLDSGVPERIARWRPKVKKGQKVYVVSLGPPYPDENPDEPDEEWAKPGEVHVADRIHDHEFDQHEHDYGWLSVAVGGGRSFVVAGWLLVGSASEPDSPRPAVGERALVLTDDHQRQPWVGTVVVAQPEWTQDITVFHVVYGRVRVSEWAILPAPWTEDPEELDHVVPDECSDDCAHPGPRFAPKRRSSIPPKVIPRRNVLALPEEPPVGSWWRGQEWTWVRRTNDTEGWAAGNDNMGPTSIGFWNFGAALAKDGPFTVITPPDGRDNDFFRCRDCSTRGTYLLDDQDKATFLRKRGWLIMPDPDHRGLTLARCPECIERAEKSR